MLLLPPHQWCRYLLHTGGVWQCGISFLEMRQHQKGETKKYTGASTALRGGYNQERRLTKIEECEVLYPACDERIVNRAV